MPVARSACRDLARAVIRVQWLVSSPLHKCSRGAPPSIEIEPVHLPHDALDRALSFNLEAYDTSLRGLKPEDRPWTSQLEPNVTQTHVHQAGCRESNIHARWHEARVMSPIAEIEWRKRALSRPPCPPARILPTALISLIGFRKRLGAILLWPLPFTLRSKAQVADRRGKRTCADNCRPCGVHLDMMLKP